jgi:glutamate carboxypeptidase
MSGGLRRACDDRRPAVALGRLASDGAGAPSRWDVAREEDEVAAGLEAVLADLRELVEIESPSSDPVAVRTAATTFLGQLHRHLDGEGEVADDGLLTWQSGPTPAGVRHVLVLGHLDTVWPHGTLDRLPFELRDGRVTGPGVFDMKAGLVVAVHAMARLAAGGRLPPVRLLITPDEEIGAPRSRDIILAEAARCGRVLVPEPSGPGGAVKVGRKGMAWGRVLVHGRAAHSGLDPDRGVNAAVALGRLLPEVEALGDASAGTTVVPTLVRAGTAINTVPARGEADLDIRFRLAQEAQRVRDGLAALAAPSDTRVETEVVVNRGPLTPAAAEPLLPALRAAETAAGLAGPLPTVEVGGASDGNLAAQAGAAVLDGLGPLGDGAHADHEHVVAGDLLPRVRLLSELIQRVALIEVAVG